MQRTYEDAMSHLVPTTEADQRRLHGLDGDVHEEEPEQ